MIAWYHAVIDGVLEGGIACWHSLMASIGGRHAEAHRYHQIVGVRRLRRFYLLACRRPSASWPDYRQHVTPDRPKCHRQTTR